MTTTVDRSFSEAPVRTHRERRWFVVSVLVLAGLGLFFSQRAWQDRWDPKTTVAVSADELEEIYGTKIVLVAATAHGGLVDIRLVITDAQKAEHLFHDEDTLPVVIIEETGQELRPGGGHKHNVEIVDGSYQSIRFPNSDGLVQDGALVTVVIQGVAVQHLVATS